MFLFRASQAGGRTESLCRRPGGETSGRMETSGELYLDPAGSRCSLQRSGLWLCCFCGKERGVLRETCVVDQIFLCSAWSCSEGVCIIRFLFPLPDSYLFRLAPLTFFSKCALFLRVFYFILTFSLFPSNIDFFLKILTFSSKCNIFLRILLFSPKCGFVEDSILS